MVKKWLKITVFSILLLGIILILTEISLRIIALFPKDSRFFINDSLLGYRIRPHIAFMDGVLTNAYGFNDIDHSLEKIEGTKRITFIGDSITFGLRRKENFVFTFEQKAVENGMKIEALNMGIPGADPGTYLKILKNDALKMNCDVAAVMFFIGNDILQAHKDFETKIHMDQPKTLLKYPWKAGFSSEYFYTYRFLRTNARIITELTKDKKADGTFTKGNFMDIEKRCLPIYHNPSTPFIRDCYTGALKALKSLSIQARENKMKFFVVLVPTEVQVNDELRQELFNTYKLDTRYYDFGLPQRIIKESLDKQEILCLDLLPSFKTNAKEAPLYIRQDTHWNKMGHDTAATQILDFVKENKLM